MLLIKFNFAAIYKNIYGDMNIQKGAENDRILRLSVVFKFHLINFRETILNS